MTATRHAQTARRMARASLVLVGLAPLLVTLLRRSFPPGSMDALLDAPFSLVCHQRLERTLVLAGARMPVCSRCAGLYLGAALGALLPGPKLAPRTARSALLATGLLVALEVVLQDAGVHPPWHPSRLASGFAFGLVAARALLSRLADERDAEDARAERRAPR